MPKLHQETDGTTFKQDRTNSSQAMTKTKNSENQTVQNADKISESGVEIWYMRALNSGYQRKMCWFWWYWFDSS